MGFKMMMQPSLSIVFIISHWDFEMIINGTGFKMIRIMI